MYIQEKLPPGKLLIKSLRCRGGIQYRKSDEASDVSGDTETTEWVTVKMVDHKTAVERIETVRKAINYLERKLGAATPFGVFIPASQEAGFMQSVRRLEDDARRANEYAELVGCARRIEFAMILCTPTGDHTFAAETLKACAEKVTGLRHLVDAREVGQPLTSALSAAIGIERLVPGVVADVLIEAISEVRENAKLVRKAARAGDVIPALEWPMNEAAVGWLAPAADYHSQAARAAAKEQQ